MCTRQHKNKSKEVEAPDLQKWHSKFRERYIRLVKTKLSIQNGEDLNLTNV